MNHMNLKRRLRHYLNNRIVKPGIKEGIKEAILSAIPTVQHIAAIFPHETEQPSYTLPAYPGEMRRHPDSPFPIPPDPLWADYCTTVETYLQSGLDDTTTMRRLLLDSGAPIEQLGRILELGVAGGRLIRHLVDLVQQQEIWGLDVWASAIIWCKEYLSPPFHFATTTVAPHLPFEDRSFGLVFAGSVWTHIDDLVEAWALEVHRILRPGGRLYFTINDRAAVKVFEGGGLPENRARYVERVRPDTWSDWLKLLKSHSGYQRFARGDAQMVTMGRSTQAHVMWDVDYLLKRWGPGWSICSVTPEAYGHQTGVLLACV
jgi:SAM-dependent methyltransferase